ncbi:uncharacterized protein DUF5103 [Balneicella halophila]|uniref:Uncharacterized protein DUF5103 n=1 Tax=Balneicella halophila TaxID=1537566 RepID=A0A7L4US81_BALHA|nr:type IX secretion system plug protein domain-containing protein [Balneicella halophila]PVX52620.1 uncharacterized protein DUF5103 [Balneicella halophila]
MKHYLLLLFIIILNTSILNGQVLDDKLYKEDIRSIQFSPQGYDLGYPILHSENSSSLQLTFDLMGDSQPALAYRLIHCDVNWEKSKIQSNDYLVNSFNEFYIENYELSLASQQLYTHYTAIIEKEQLKLSGNYIIQIFPEDNPEIPWLQLRFVYAESLVDIKGAIEKATNNLMHNTHQRIKFEVEYDKTTFPYPRTNVTALILQNYRWESQQTFKPLFIQNNKLKFNYIDNRGLFNGNYEFPFFDTSNILQTSHTIRTLEQDDEGVTHCYLYPNKTASNNYFYSKDMNGNYAIQAENTYETNIEADYVWVHFTLISEELPNKAYVVGRFNQWKADETSELIYDGELRLYHVGLFLKQGVYNYTFVTKDSTGKQINLLGNYSETENDYYIFIYYKDERLQTDKLIGWKRLNSENGL